MIEITQFSADKEPDTVKVEVPAKKSPGRPKKVVAEEPAPVEEPAQVEDTPEPTEDTPDDDTLIKQIQETVKAAMTRPGVAPTDIQAKWIAIRNSLGCERVPDLKGNTEALLSALVQAKKL